ncbi:hypothetical protein ACWGQ2_12620 [Arthrobacter sp. NPDC055585]
MIRSVPSTGPSLPRRQPPNNAGRVDGPGYGRVGRRAGRKDDGAAALVLADTPTGTLTALAGIVDPEVPSSTRSAGQRTHRT